MKIAFHSYKGGVGRTKIMAGVGALLATRGHRVGMLDFDLDSSGLVAICDGDADAIGRAELLNILREQHTASIPPAVRDVNELVEQRFQVALRETGGRLRYLPTVADPRVSDEINLNNLNVFLAALLDTFAEDCGVDIVLIDIKPGYSPSFKAIIPHVGRAVVVSRLDPQNIRGLARLLPDLERTDVKTFVVANMIPQDGSARLVNLIDEHIGKLEAACGRAVDVRVPYDPELMFDKDFARVADAGSPVRRELERLADMLVPR